MSRTKSRDFSNVPDIEFARLAAWVDGEGCLTLVQSGRPRRTMYYATRMLVTQANLEVMAWLVNTFGGTFTKSKGTNTPCYIWCLASADLDEVLIRCMPFFIVKRRQAQLFQEYRRTLQKGTSAITPEMALYRESIRQELRFTKCPWERPTQEVAEPAPVTDAVQ